MKFKQYVLRKKYLKFFVFLLKNRELCNLFISCLPCICILLIEKKSIHKTLKRNMIKVYRMINVTKEEVYHGISENPQKRKAKSHCVSKTVAVRHWDCANDKIIMKEVSKHRTQTKASSVAHELEREYKHHRKFKNIKTKGK